MARLRFAPCARPLLAITNGSARKMTRPLPYEKSTSTAPSLSPRCTTGAAKFSLNSLFGTATPPGIPFGTAIFSLGRGFGGGGGASSNNLVGAGVGVGLGAGGGGGGGSSWSSSSLSALGVFISSLAGRKVRRDASFEIAMPRTSRVNSVGCAISTSPFGSTNSSGCLSFNS